MLLFVLKKGSYLTSHLMEDFFFQTKNPFIINKNPIQCNPDDSQKYCYES